MMRSTTSMPIFWATLAVILFSGSVLAKDKPNSGKMRNYGLGHPKSPQDLPYGQLRKQLEALPPKAKGKAMGWLQGISFPLEDVKALKVNKHGEVSYSDSFLPAEVDGTEPTAEVMAAENINAISAFQLHSLPGSSNVLYLDFDGETLTNTAWNEGTLEALPFDPSNNDSPATEANFTQNELDRIHEIWHRISEDFAAFDIDVTTERPDVFTATTGHVLVTHDVDANGVDFPSKNAGGVAWLNVFGRDDYVSRYSPALVYYTNLGSGYAPYVAEAGSHEFGHNIGLSHDGLTDGTTYYTGHGSGLVDWSPIMGSSYQRNLTQWSKGEYNNANNPQDDIAIIAGDLGFAGDDHADSSSGATPLVVEANGDILVSSPEIDPENVLPYNKGVIDDSADTDWFSLDIAEAGVLNLSATPSWHSFTRQDYRGSNMDIELTLMDSDLNIQAYDESGSITNAQISTSVQPGRYYVQIDGIGNDSVSNYSDYATMGMYFIEGSVPSGTPVEDNEGPTPGTMAWQTSPTANDESSISMVSVTASDPSGGVEYYFTCVAGEEAGCVDSGWQSENSYTVNGLTADTYYAFKVRARDALGNENLDSPTMGDTTHTSEPPLATNEKPIAVVSYTPDQPNINKGNSVDVTLSGSDSYDPDGHITSWSWKDSSGSTVASGATYTTRLREGSHNFTLVVTDDAGDSATTTISFTVTKGSVDDGGDENPKGKKPPRNK